MKTLLINLLILCQAYALYAGDDICSATFLDSNTDIPEVFSGVGGTSSAVVPPPFGGYVGPDTWFQFVMPASGQVYLLLEGLGMVNPAIAVYEGPCSDPTLLYNVLDNNCDGSLSPQLLIDELVPGTTYFVRVWPEDGSANGTFAINLTQTLPTLPSFEVFADAFVDNECIQLTTESTGLQGCAWYQIPIDFNQPFTHTMSANFGDIDANGADGICLVYQSNGPNFCGATGGGIGAEGMPNSAIFEFDTWQNDPFVDPVLDHTSLNVNGDMNHANSINGPITLGNIEDGLDHTITLEWQPAGNLYSLYFDNILQLTGSYDFINNCFGGNSTAYWGYTSSTGGSFNNQIICPEVEDYAPATVSYEAVTICEGDSYDQYTMEGFYIDTYPGANGCQRQHHIDLTVAPQADDQFVDTTICAGDFLVIDGVDYSTPAIYDIYDVSEFGCDSVTILTVKVLDGTVVIEDPDTLDCQTTEVIITADASANFPNAIIGYSWPSVFGANGDQITVDEAGTYAVNVSFTVDGLTCTATDQVNIIANTTLPIIDTVEDVYISCDSTAINQLVNNTVDGDLQYTWYYETLPVSNTTSAPIAGEGTYIFTAFDPESNCLVSDTVEVLIDDELPSLAVAGQNLNCQVESFVPEVSVSDDVIAYTWSDDFGIVSDMSAFEITDSGTYTLQVTNAAGCTAIEQLVIEIDTLQPQVSLPDAIIPCDQSSVSIEHTIDSTYNTVVQGPQGIVASEAIWQISEVGTYIIEVTDTANYCTNADTFEVASLGTSPVLALDGGLLTCAETVVTLSVVSDLADVGVLWQTGADTLGAAASLSVSEPGLYTVEVVSETGCRTIDSIEVAMDTLTPVFSWTSDSLSCTHTSATLTIDTETGYGIKWFDQFGSELSSADMLETSVAGQYVAQIVNPANGCEVFQLFDVESYAVEPDFELRADTLTCADSLLFLDFSIENTYLDLEWTGPNGFVASDLNPEISEAGVYRIYVQLTEDCVLDTSVSIGLDVDLPELAVATDSITCAQPFAEILLDYEPTVEISVTNEAGVVTAQNIILTDVSGLYEAELVGANGCTSSFLWEVLAYTEEPTVTAESTGPITCAVTEVELSASSDAIDATYTWQGPAGYIADGIQSEAISGGVYTVQVVDVYGCSSEATVEVSENTDIPTLELFGDDIDCINTSTTLSYSSDGEDLLVSWQDDSGNDVSNTVSAAGTYICIVTDAFGCSNMAEVEISAFADPPEIYSVYGQVIEVDEEQSNAQIVIEVETNGSYELFWTPAEVLSCIDCLDPYLTAFGEESINVAVVNEYGCADELTIDLRYRKKQVVQLPNVFSPNGDGTNDYFTVYGNEQIASVLRFDIYDRWGGLVWKNANFLPNIDEEGWDGTHKGEAAMSGVYVYVTEIMTAEGETLRLIGDVTIVR